ncbi:type II secretion system F family protein [Vibrio sp. TBV020]|uniref:type II secretion system F family protein n=1 Tax=Vibrio sp. TBV020 TaxID=3137398 RepID=UPI0038CD83E7
MSLYIGIALLSFGIVGSILGFVFASQSDALKKRLDSVAIVNSGATSSKLKWSWKRNPERSRKLSLIGYVSRSAETTFMLIRAILMLSGAVVWYFHQQLAFDAQGVAQSVAIAFVVGIFVDKVIDWRVHAVRQDIARTIPDVLDLMVVCVSSGQSLEATFYTVGKEMKSISPALSREWLFTSTEMSVLDSPLSALANLDQRLVLPEVNNMAVTMSQAIKFGTPMAEALKLIASDNRQYHLLELEEWVGKIPAKMSFPLVVFIMLPVVVIIVAPTVLSLFNTLGQL